MMAAGSALAAGPGAALARPEVRSTTGFGVGVETSRSDPRAEMARLGARARTGGILLSVLVVVIVTLMSSKPQL